MIATPEQARAFAGCGFTNRLISALVDFGYTRPEQLLPLSRKELGWIINVGRKGRALIEAYRERVRAGAN